MKLERDDRVNWSTLKNIGQSPKFYRYRLDVPREDTDALLLGQVTHTAIYEPELFPARYAVMPRFHGGCGDAKAIEKGYEGGKQAKEAWMLAHADQTHISSEDYTGAWSMATSLRNDPVASEFVVGGTVEQMIEWTDEDTGILCRGRVDHTGKGLSDLKTTRNITPRHFMRDIAQYQYYGQMAYYYDGLLANGVEMTDRPCIVAVENKAPYDTLVVEFSDEDIEAGRMLYKRYLALLVDCRERDYWPGVGIEQRVPLVLPEYVKPKLELTMGGEVL